MIENAVSVQGSDGAYYHYLEVCKLLKLQQQGYTEEEVEDIMAETWIQCIGNDGNNFKKVRNKILKQLKNK